MKNEKQITRELWKHLPPTFFLASYNIIRTVQTNSQHCAMKADGRAMRSLQSVCKSLTACMECLPQHRRKPCLKNITDDFDNDIPPHIYMRVSVRLPTKRNSPFCYATEAHFRRPTAEAAYRPKCIALFFFCD